MIATLIHHSILAEKRHISDQVLAASSTQSPYVHMSYRTNFQLCDRILLMACVEVWGKRGDSWCLIWLAISLSTYLSTLQHLGRKLLRNLSNPKYLMDLPGRLSTYAYTLLFLEMYKHERLLRDAVHALWTPEPYGRLRHYVREVPDVAVDFSSLATRNSPYIPLPSKGSYLELDNWKYRWRGLCDYGDDKMVDHISNMIATGEVCLPNLWASAMLNSHKCAETFVLYVAGIILKPSSPEVALCGIRNFESRITKWLAECRSSYRQWHCASESTPQTKPGSVYFRNDARKYVGRLGKVSVVPKYTAELWV